MLAGRVVYRGSDAVEEIPFWWKEGSSEPEKKRVEAPGRPGCVKRQKRAAGRLSLGVERRARPRAWHLCAQKG